MNCRPNPTLNPSESGNAIPGHVLCARHVIKRIFNPRVMSKVASCELASSTVETERPVF